MMEINKIYMKEYACPKCGSKEAIRAWSQREEV